MKKKISEEEKNYNSWWKEIIEKDGVMDREQIMKELLDYTTLMENVSIVYDHITGGRISEEFTDPHIVISIVEDRENEDINEAIEEAVKETEVEYKEKIRDLKIELGKLTNSIKKMFAGWGDY